MSRFKGVYFFGKAEIYEIFRHEKGLSNGSIKGMKGIMEDGGRFEITSLEISVDE